MLSQQSWNALLLVLKDGAPALRDRWTDAPEPATRKKSKPKGGT